MKKNPKKMAEVVKVLQDLCVWSQIEGGLERDEKAAHVWRTVNNYVRGVAYNMGLDLNERLTNEQRLQRQGRIFNHAGQCGKIIT